MFMVLVMVLVAEGGGRGWMALRVKLNPDTYDITNVLPVPFLFFNLFCPFSHCTCPRF